MEGKTLTENIDPKRYAIIAATAADSKKASDIVVQELTELSSVCDYFVIVTAKNNLQVAAVISEIEDQLRTEGGIKPIGREGEREGSWALLDYGCIVIHVFQEEARDYYRLESLWNNAPVLDLEKEAGLSNLEYSITEN